MKKRVSIVAVETCDRQRWESLSRTAAPNFYGRAEWLESTCAALALEPRYLVVTMRNAPVIRCALAMRRRLGFGLLMTVPVAAYAGWAESFPSDLAAERGALRRNEALDELAAWCEAHAAYARIVLPPELTDARPLLWRGWRGEQRYTYRFDPSSGREFDLRKNARRNLERAQAAGLAVIHPAGAEAVDALDGAIRATYARRGEPLPVRSAMWRSYLARLVEMDTVRVLAATDGSAVHAAVALGTDAAYAYELLAGTSDAGTTNGASVLLLSTAIRESAESGRGFDFSGANMPSIAHFKRGFGGKLVPYIAVSWARNGAARWLAERAPGVKRKMLGMVGR